MAWALALAIAFAAGVAIVIALTPRATDRRTLRPNVVVRAFRVVRSVWVRALLFPIGWPHLVDLFLGAAAPHVPSAAETVWQRGSTRVLRYVGVVSHKEPVLVVHSLVTKASILDLVEGRSLTQNVADNGFDVYLLDWGDVGRTESLLGLSEYGDVLRAAEQAVLDASGAARVHVIAYCLGSTLVLRDRAANPRESVASLSLLAPLADFAVPGGLRPILSWRWLRPSLVLDGDSCIPAAVVRESFHALRPQAVAAMRLRVARRHDPEYCRFYAAFARWAWDQHRLPGALFYDLVDLYRGDAPFELGALAAIKQPVWVAIAERDHLVPSGASHALTTIAGLDVAVVNVASGHVSMIVGTAAKQTVWPALVSFLERQQPVRRRRRRGVNAP
ncbi:MAG: poly[(R)-3-hydroxyalkanoate] polymerase subunit PhaC [Actinomycetota bacterium]